MGSRSVFALDMSILTALFRALPQGKRRLNRESTALKNTISRRPGLRCSGLGLPQQRENLHCVCVCAPVPRKRSDVAPRRGARRRQKGQLLQGEGEKFATFCFRG